MRLTQTGLAVGTPHYIAPEQARGEEPDCRSDIYSLGCTLYHALAGRTPFDGSNAMAVMQRHINDEVPRLSAVRPGISPAMEAVVDRMMAKAPERRYQSAAEAAEDLGRVIAGEPPRAMRAAMAVRRPGTTAEAPVLRPTSGRRMAGRQTSRTTMPVAPIGPRRLLPVLLAAGGALILGATAILFWAVSRGDRVKMPAPEQIVAAPSAPEDPLKALAGRFREAQDIEAASPGQYDRPASIYRSLVRDGAGTEFAAKAGEALAALERRRAAGLSAERLRGLADGFEKLVAAERVGPENFAELIAGYERFAGEASGTEYEAKARQAAEALRRRRTARTGELLADLRGRVDAAQAADRFAAALGEIASFPQPHASEAGQELAALHGKVIAAGEARWLEILKRGKSLIAEEKFDDADAALRAAKDFGLPGLDTRIEAALAEVSAAQAALAAARTAESEKAYGEFSAGFASLLTANDHGGIAALGAKVEDRLLPEHAARVRADLALAAGAGAFLRRLRARLTGRPAGNLPVHMPMGTATFQKYMPETDKLTVKLRSAGANALVDFELPRIDRAELVAMSRRCAELTGGGFAPAEALEAACFMLAGGREEGVKELLDTARAGGLDVADLAARFDVLGKGAREAEAGRLLAEFDRLCQATDGAAVVAAGERLLKDYGDTAAVKARAKEMAALMEKARPENVPTPPEALGTIVFRQGEPVPALRIDSYAGTADTTLARKDPNMEGPERGHGGAKALTVVINKDGKEGRSVIRFDLSGIPATARVQKAVVRLTCRSVVQDMTVGAYRVTSPWEPSESEMAYDIGASWTYASGKGKGRVPWKNPGGDFDSATDWGSGPTGLLCRPVPFEGLKHAEFDITALVQAWVSGKAPNYGILLKPETPNATGNWAGFDASESDAVEKRPALTITLNSRRLVGGETPGGYSVTWTQVTPKFVKPDGRPSPVGLRYRSGTAGAAYDAARGLCLLCGGGRDDLWAYDAGANAWICIEEGDEKHRADGVTRPNRTGDSSSTPLVCTPAGDHYWLACGEKGELWSFDPQTFKWQRKTEIGKPVHALGFCGKDKVMAFLGDREFASGSCLIDLKEAKVIEAKLPPAMPIRSTSAAPGGLCADADGNLLFFGGMQNWKPVDSTWAWSTDEGTFKELRPAAKPPARVSPALAANPARGLWAIFGGQTVGASGKWSIDNKTLRDTWVFSAHTNTWTEVKGITPPPEDVASCAMWWDTKRGLLVLQEVTGTKPRTWIGRLELTAQ
jgi:hypothetical protein